MIEREGDILFTQQELKRKAKQLIRGSDSSIHFKASDGWAKKFCYRNKLILDNKYNVPAEIPK
jgi:hypothetical protein